MLANLTLLIILQGKYYYASFTDGETEPESGSNKTNVTRLGSCRPGFESQVCLITKASEAIS